MRTAGPVIVLIALALLIPLYIAGLGPAVWLHRQGVGRQVIEIVYAPLEMTARQVDFLKQPLDAYVKLWSAAPPPVPTPPPLLKAVPATTPPAAPTLAPTGS